MNEPSVSKHLQMPLTFAPYPPALTGPPSCSCFTKSFKEDWTTLIQICPRCLNSGWDFEAWDLRPYITAKTWRLLGSVEISTVPGWPDYQRILIRTSGGHYLSIQVAPYTHPLDKEVAYRVRSSLSSLTLTVEDKRSFWGRLMTHDLQDSMSKAMQTLLSQQPLPPLSALKPEPSGPTGKQIVGDLIAAIPGLKGLAVSCPAAKRGEYCVSFGPDDTPPLTALIPHVNDDHHWTREEIADWLDTLDADLSFA